MGEWIPLDDEATQDYLDGYLVPLDVRETEHGVEVWMPHEMQTGWLTGVRTCSRCGLLSMDYDALTVPCEN